jgi:hypothetical protein
MMGRDSGHMRRKEFPAIRTSFVATTGVGTFIDVRKKPAF